MATQATWTKCEIEFISGSLKGIKIQQWIVASLATVGKRTKGSLGGSDYKVLSVGRSVDTYSPPRD